MFTLVYRFARLGWRYRSLIAIALTFAIGLWERHRHRLPEPLRRVNPPKLPGDRRSADRPS